MPVQFRRLDQFVQSHRNREGEQPGTIYILEIPVYETAARENHGRLRKAPPLQCRPAEHGLFFLGPAVVLTVTRLVGTSGAGHQCVAGVLLPGSPSPL